MPVWVLVWGRKPNAIGRAFVRAGFKVRVGPAGSRLGLGWRMTEISHAWEDLMRVVKRNA